MLPLYGCARVGHCTFEMGLSSHLPLLSAVRADQADILDAQPRCDVNHFLLGKLVAGFVQRMNSKPTAGIPMPPVYEVQHLRAAFERLEGLGATNSPTIGNLKRILLLRIAELESVLECRHRTQA
jgi:hypothetical protein